MKLLIFGGTSEGRILAKRLTELGHEVTVSTATALGAEELCGIPCRKIWGRMDEKAIAEAAKAYDVIIDATHPYALEVTANIRKALGGRKKLIRVLRREGEAGNVVTADSCAGAAAFLQHTEGRILLTTGAKELHVFGSLPTERLYARILPTHEGLAACEALSLPHRQIIAMQGPFSEKMNEALIEQLHISWLVTKNSGRAGGFEEKRSACEKTGARMILVKRPEDEGISPEEAIREVERLCQSGL